MGWGGGDRIGTIGRRVGGGNGEGKMERGQRERGDGRGAKGRGRRRVGGILQMDMIQAHGMPGWNEATDFSVLMVTLFTRATPGTPASAYIKASNKQDNFFY